MVIWTNGNQKNQSRKMSISSEEMNPYLKYVIVRGKWHCRLECLFKIPLRFLYQKLIRDGNAFDFKLWI